MAQNKPQRKETPPGPSPNSPSLLFEYQCRSGKYIRLANQIESKKIDSVVRIESNRIESTLFCPNWNALLLTISTVGGKVFVVTAQCLDHPPRLRIEHQIFDARPHRGRVLPVAVGRTRGRQHDGQPSQNQHQLSRAATHAPTRIQDSLRPRSVAAPGRSV